MKKILATLAFALLIIFPSVSHAQEQITATPTPTPTPVQYNIAYPGLLPDSPLYKLKVLRDKITLFLIGDPIKKAEYYLLLADKQIYASKFLVDKKEIVLAKDTALKGENEYTLITFLLKDTGQKPDKAFFDKLETAALKHQEILSGIIAKVPNKDKGTFETIIEFSKRNADQIKTIYNNY